MVRGGAERYIGLGGDGAVAQSGEALAADDPDRRVDDALASLGIVAARGHQWVPPRFSTTTPPMISSIPATLVAVSASPRKSMPIAAMTAVPAPAQIA